MGTEVGNEKIVLLTRQLNTTAPSNSKRGIVCLLVGAIQVLDAIKLTSTLPSLKYTTAANALSDALQKPYN